MKIKVLLIALLISSVTPLLSQSYFNVFSGNGTLAPSNGYSDKDANLSIVNMGGSALLPISIDSNKLVLLGLSANNQNFRYTEGTDIDENMDITALGLQVGWQSTTKQGNKRLFMLVPSLKSDMNEIDKNHYQLGALFLYTKKVNEKLSLKYGLFANTEFFGPFFNPLFGIDYKMDKDWRLFGTLPSYLTLEKKINDSFRAGLDLRITTTSYQLGNNTGGLYLEQSSKSIAGMFEVYPAKNIAIRLTAGHSIAQEFGFYKGNQKDNFNILGVGFGSERTAEPMENFQNLKDGWIYGVSLFYRVELDK